METSRLAFSAEWKNAAGQTNSLAFGQENDIVRVVIQELLPAN